MAAMDITQDEFGSWLRDLPQTTLVAVQITSTDPAVLVKQDSTFQYYAHTRGRAVDGIVAGYQSGQLTDPAWLVTYRALCAASFSSGQLIAAQDALVVFDTAFPAEKANPELDPLPG